MARARRPRLLPRSPPWRLAVGSSKRMGLNKLLLPLDGRPMIQHTLDALRGSDFKGITLVGGPQSLRLRLRDHPLHNRLRIVNNPDYTSGLASSLRQGLKQLPSGHDCLLLPFLAIQVAQPRV